jgi:adenylate kinase
MCIILTGIPGVGKSTVLNALKEVCNDITIVNYGEVMLQQATLQGLDRDSLRKLPVEQQQEIGLMACHQIAEQSHPLTIIDTHACIKTPFGFCPGLPLRVLQILEPTMLVQVYSSPEIILRRRRNDHLRKRDEETLSDLTLHQDLTRSFLISASTFTGATLYLINNDSDTIFGNIQPLVNSIKDAKRNISMAS